MIDLAYSWLMNMIFFLWWLRFLQERLLGAAIGSGLVGFIIFEQRKRIYESISDYPSQLDTQSQV